MRGRIVFERTDFDGSVSAIQIPFDDPDLAETASQLPWARWFPRGGIAIRLYLPIAERCPVPHVNVRYVPFVTWKDEPPGRYGEERAVSDRLARYIIAKVLADAALATCALDEQL